MMSVSLERQKTAVAWLSVLSNSVLVVFKLLIGTLIGSVSVISEAIHSGVDLIAAVIALFAVTQSKKPADHDHPFGHGKFENISGTIEALLIFFAAGWIIYEAVHKLNVPQPIEAPGWGIAIMAISSIVNLGVSHCLFKVGKRTDSVALEADAWHLRTDVYTSAGVMVGLLIVGAGRWLFPDLNLAWVDPVAAIGVALLIVKAAYDLTLQSARDLFDVSLPLREVQVIEATLRTFESRVRGFHRLRTRKSGAQRFVEFHLLVDPLMTVEASHVIADELIEQIREKFPQASVTVHVEPCNGKCHQYCVAGCFLPAEQRQAK